MRPLALIILMTAWLIVAAVGQSPPAERSVTNVLYRPEPDASDAVRRFCRLDLHLPGGTNGFTTVVWFHGGGLTGGKRDFPAGLRGQGFAVVTADYRLSPDSKAPTYLEDAAAAVAWTFRNIAAHGGNTNRIFVSGHSAGGYLTSMIGLDKRWLAPFELHPDLLAGLIPFSGQCITHFTVRAERGVPEKQPVLDDLAPLHHVRPDAPPLLLVTGGRDRELLGRYEENAYLWRMMKEVGHTNTELFELQGFDHGQMAEPACPLLVRFVAKTLARLDQKSARTSAKTAIQPLTRHRDLSAFLDARFGPRLGNAWDYTFAPGPFPPVEWDRPEIVAKVLGALPSMTVRWFDERTNEVARADQPGRYGFQAVGQAPDGRIIRRGGTVFCRPPTWDGWSEKPRALLDFIPLDGLSRPAWDRNREVIADFAGRSILLSMLRQEEGAVLLSWLHEHTGTNAPPESNDTPLIRDAEFHLALKRKMLGSERPLVDLPPPRRIEARHDTRLRSAPDPGSVPGFKPGTADRVRTVAREWFERSREPFHLVVARRGIVLLDDVFGSYSWGPLTRESPAEIASITKLVTGLLFARFLDQRLIGLDDPVGNYLPDFLTTGDDVLTVRHLFTHATALDGHETWGGLHNPWLENVVANAGAQLHPGRIHHYNGIGYDLAGRIMETVTGRSVFRLVREQLFEPMQLTRTTLSEDLGFSCFSTATDLAKLGQLLLNQGTYGDRIYFLPATLESMKPTPLKPFYPALRADLEWGIGLTWMRQARPTNAAPAAGNFTGPILGRNILGHGSATSAILRVDYDHDLVIAQSRRRAGPEYEHHLTRLLLALETGLE